MMMCEIVTYIIANTSRSNHSHAIPYIGLMAEHVDVGYHRDLPIGFVW